MYEGKGEFQVMHNLGRREERETGGKNYKDGGEESWFYLSLLGYIESSFP